MSASDWMNSPEMKRAALIGIASNPAQPISDRLAIALQVIGELETAVAAARREGLARAIEALREHDAEIRAELTNDEGRLDWESYEPTYDLAADYLTDRAAALTEEGGQ